LLSLFDTSDFDVALQEIDQLTQVAAITRSDNGSVIMKDGARHNIDIVRAAQVVDLTGAGDQYAAGFLTGLTRHYSLEACGKLGSLTVWGGVSTIGGRPENDLATLVNRAVASSCACLALPLRRILIAG